MQDNQTIVVIGLGQLGRIFAGGFLRTSHTVVPVNRDDDMRVIAQQHPAPALVLVAVAENDLHPVLQGLPNYWRSRVGLIQNELLPRDWQAHQLNDPTVASVWFEKKSGTDAKPLIATPVQGPQAKCVVQALTAINIPAREVPSEAEMEYELVRKNVYILTTNISGIRVGGNVGELWSQHRDLATEVANEVMDIQDWLTGKHQDRARLLAGMIEAIDADPQHGCKGRSAPDRLKRNLHFADQAGLPVAMLRAIAASVFA